jgi:XTP/dITP diphosphohydrolase
MRRFTGTELWWRPTTRGKLEEIAHLLEPFGISVSSAKDHGLPEPEETGTTFVENARIKAHAAARPRVCPRFPTIAGSRSTHWMVRPGVYTADWAETPTGRDFVMAMNAPTMRWRPPMRPSPAPHGSAARWCWHGPMGMMRSFPARPRAALSGRCAASRDMGMTRSSNPMGMTSPSAEMDRWEKNRISHRADAFAKLVKIFGPA